MKTNLIKTACLACLSAALVWPNETAQAQTTTNLFTFDSNAEGFTFPSWAGEGSSSFWDGTQDAGSGSGSLYLYQDMSGGGGQLVGFQNFSLNAYYPYVWDNDAGSNVLYSKDLSTYTNLSIDIKWDTTYSSIGINDYNTEAFVGGNGTWGLELDFVTGGASQNWTWLATIQIPTAASNGWTHVNVPIPTGLPVDQTVGFVFKKYTGGGTGTAALWVDNITVQAPGEAPPAPILSRLAPITQGLNIFDDGSAYDRQNIATVVTNQPAITYVTNEDTTITTNVTLLPSYAYGWVGNPTPVTYSVSFAKFPDASYNGYEAHFFIVPGTNVTETAPDWNEANALVLYMQRQGDGSVLGQLRYKVNDANDNSSLFGSNTNVFGPNPSQAFTNTIVAGYGGLLGSVTNGSNPVGTWTITIDHDTNIVVHTADGHTGTMAFPQLSDAQAFAGPVTVFWGTQPNSGNWQQDVVLSHVSITGSPNSLSADLSLPLDPAKMVVRAANSTLIIKTPTNAAYWLQWLLPDSGFQLLSTTNLTGSWTTNYPASYTVGGKRSVFITADMLPSTGSGFFRLRK